MFTHYKAHLSSLTPKSVIQEASTYKKGGKSTLKCDLLSDWYSIYYRSRNVYCRRHGPGFHREPIQDSKQCGVYIFKGQNLNHSHSYETGYSCGLRGLLIAWQLRLSG